MDLRTKLVFALVAVSLVSMLGIGALSYPRARDLLRVSARQLLEGVAESKENDLENLVASWHSRVQLFTSRTQLRLSLDRYNRLRTRPDSELVARIISDAVRSSSAVRDIVVYDRAGEPIAASGSGRALQPLDLARIPEGDESRFEGLHPLGPDSIGVAFIARLSLDDETVGAATVVMDAQELFDITDDYTGLGETGEVVIAFRDGDSALIVNPLRHERGPPMSRRIALDRSNDPVARAVSGVEDVFTTRTTDYRGETVWAATRFLPEVGWGLTVKVDASEQEQPIRDLRRTTIRLALALSAFVSLVGILLGLHIAGPIHELAEVANRIRAGELDARVENDSDDEIGLLARTFNLMADEVLTANPDVLDRARQRMASGSPPDTGG